jgi:hypothetical protein
MAPTDAAIAGPEEIPGRVARVVLAAVAVVVVAGAWPFLRHGAPAGGDNPSHLAEIMEVASLLRAGQTDFWTDRANLGYPLFLAYQPGPTLTLGALSSLLSGVVAPVVLFKATIVAALALLPTSFYASGRWLGLQRGTSLVLGLLSLAVHDLSGFGLGIDSAGRTGLFTQAVGAVLLPLVIARAHRLLVRQEPGVVPTALLLTALGACHLFLAGLAGLAMAVMVAHARAGIVLRARRLAVVAGVAAGLLAFSIVPFLTTLDAQGGIPSQRAFGGDARLGSLAVFAIRGEMFDHDRLPWVTALVIVGVVTAIRRRREPLARVLLALLALSTYLFLGRQNLGRLYFAPLASGSEEIRYLVGIQLSGLVLAAMACGHLARWVREQASRRLTYVPWPGVLAAALAVYLFVCFGAVRRGLLSHDDDAPTWRQLVSAGADSSAGGGRIMATASLGTPEGIYGDLLPAEAGRPGLMSTGRGFHDSRSTYGLYDLPVEAPALALFDVSTLVARGPLPASLAPAPTPLVTSAGATVYHVDAAPHRFEFVRTPVVLVGTRDELRDVAGPIALALYGGAHALAVVRGTEPSAGDRLVFPAHGAWRAVIGGVSVEGPRADDDGAHAAREAWLQSLVDRWNAGVDRASPGSVLGEDRGPNRYEADVEAAPSGDRLLVKSSYHPYWHADVDGLEVSAERVSPNLMVIDVPPGRHHVRFRFRNPWWQKAALAASLLVLLGWGAASARARATSR